MTVNQDENLLFKLQFRGVIIHYQTLRNFRKTGLAHKTFSCLNSDSWLNLFANYTEDTMYAESMSKDLFPTCEQMITVLANYHVGMIFNQITDLEGHELWPVN